MSKEQETLKMNRFLKKKTNRISRSQKLNP